MTDWVKCILLLKHDIDITYSILYEKFVSYISVNCMFIVSYENFDVSGEEFKPLFTMVLPEFTNSASNIQILYLNIRQTLVSRMLIRKAVYVYTVFCFD